MKKIFTLVCAAVLSLSVVNAEVLLTEHFNQETEALATNVNAFGDEIASNGWTNISGGGNLFINADNDLIYTGYKSATDGTKSLELKSNSVKKAATPLKKAVNSGSVFLAAIVDLQAYATTSATASTRDYLWAFANGTSSVSTAGNHFCRLQLQKIEDGKFQFGIAKGPESAAYISYTETLEFGKFLLITEYEFVDGDQNDVVRLYVNPVKSDAKPQATIESKQEAINPNTGSDMGAGTKADASQLKSILLNSSSTLKLGALIDEIKVATSWAELWESGQSGEQEEPTPEIASDDDVVFGNVAKDVAVVKEITVKGSNLKGAISVASDNEALVVSAASISKDDAEAEGGAKISLTLTPAEGNGFATVTLSADGAEDKEISVSWYGLPSVANIAALKELGDGVVVLIESEPIIVQKFEFGEYNTPHFTVQDASGAIHLADYYEVASSWQVGDAISGLLALRFDSEDFVEGFATGMVQGGAVASSDNELVPLDADIANIGAFGPALIKLAAVNFDPEVEEFAKGAIAISKGDISVNIQVKEGCDIIGEKVPASADVIGLVAHPAFNDVIQIRSSADVQNRTPRIPAAIDQQQNEKKAVKIVRNGQVVILRDGKEFNLLGTEL